MKPSITIRICSLGVIALLAASARAQDPHFRGAASIDAAAPTVSIDWSARTEPVVVRISLKSVSEYERSVRDRARNFLARVIAPNGQRISFYESPKDAFADFGSEIVLSSRGRPDRSYRLANFLNDRSLALGSVGMVRSRTGEAIVICNFVGQPSEAAEGFVIIRVSKSGLTFHALPLTLYGKVVVPRSNPNLLELWSADSSSVSGAAYPARYRKRQCNWHRGAYHCWRWTRGADEIAPNAVIDPGIEIR